MESAHGVSVVICCYNSAERLPETLHHIAKQTLPEKLSWEVIVVDNASTDRTAEVAVRLWSTYGRRVPLKVVTQVVPGVSAARDKGFEEAAFDFILFCDDDNWLGADYVRLVYELMVEHPHIGAVGGQGRAVAETELPTWFDRYSRYFAVGPQGDASGAITEVEGYLYGAGLAVRRSAFSKVQRLGFSRRLSDRTPGTLASGGDVELSYLIRLCGFGLWFDTRLEFAHFMPSGRLRWDYFLRLVEGAHRSRPYIDAYRRVMRGEAEGIGSLRWLVECWRISWRLLRRPSVLGRALLGGEGSSASYQWRRCRGEWAGWSTARSGHRILCRDLLSLRRHLAGEVPQGQALREMVAHD